MWERRFCARLPSKSESGRCEDEAFVRDFPQKVKVENVRTKLSCQTSLKEWKWKMWKRSLAVRPLGCEISWLWDLLAVGSRGCVGSLGCEISWLKSLVCEIPWPWDLLAARSHGWDLLAVRSLGWEISWLWDLLAVRSLGSEISSLRSHRWDLLAVAKKK